MIKNYPPISLGTAFFKELDYSLFISNALEAGYTHLDLAARYLNEKKIGKALKDNKVDRNSILITEKIWPCDYKENRFFKAYEEMLNRVGLTYFDIVLLHKPVKDYLGAYQRLISLREKGLAKHIGVSNFSKKQIEQIYQRYHEYPTINQIETNIYYYDLETIEYCKEKGIVVEGYSPILNKKSREEKIILDLANKYQKDATQIILRFIYQLGVIPVVKSSSLKHLKSNNDIWNFIISKEDMNLIKGLRKKDFRPLKKLLDFFGDRMNFHPEKEKI